MYGQPPPPLGYGYGAPAPQWGNNPYAPPAPGMGYPSFPAQPGTGNWLKWAYVATLALGVLLVFSGIGFMAAGAPDYESGDPGDDDLAGLGGGLMAFGFTMWFVRIIFGLIWLYSSWNSIPPEMRFTKSRTMTPGAAVGFLFIPFFNLYWLFVANVGLCDALDYGLTTVGSYRRAPRVAAIIAGIFQLVPYLNLLISPFTWLLFMFLADGARNELLTRLAQGQGGQQPQPPPMGAMAGGGYGPPPGYGAPPGYGPPPYGGGGGYPPPY
jgi:hypothetical protein